MNTTLQIRIDQKDKSMAQKVLKDLGMDLSTGIKTFIKQVVIDKALPFQPRTANGYTPAAEARILRVAGDTRKSKKVYNSVEEMFASLNK